MARPRARIDTAALADAFAAGGFHGTSSAALAAALGVAKPTLYVQGGRRSRCSCAPWRPRWSGCSTASTPRRRPPRGAARATAPPAPRRRCWPMRPRARSGRGCSTAPPACLGDGGGRAASPAGADRGGASARPGRGRPRPLWAPLYARALHGAAVGSRWTDPARPARRWPRWRPRGPAARGGYPVAGSVTTVSSCEYAGAQQQSSTRGSGPGSTACARRRAGSPRSRRPDLGLLVAKLHPPRPAREEVDLLRQAVVMRLGLPAGRHGGLRERLVLGVEDTAPASSRMEEPSSVVNAWRPPAGRRPSALLQRGHRQARRRSAAPSSARRSPSAPSTRSPGRCCGSCRRARSPGRGSRPGSRSTAPTPRRRRCCGCR